MRSATSRRRQVTLTLALGALGAATLIVGNWFADSGPFIVPIYALLIGVNTLIIRLEKIRPFGERFVVGLAAFVISSLGLYVSIMFDPDSAAISVLGHAWRLGALVLVGVAINLPTARIAEVPEPAPAG